MSKRFEIDITGDIIDLKETNKPCIALNDSEICELLNKQDEQISDLETKLAESEIKYAQLRFKQLEKDVKKYKNADKELLNENINLKDKVRELKQQLEMKDHTITNLVEDNRASQEWYKKQLAEKEKEIEDYAKINDVLHSGLSERCDKCEEEHDQDKISFAVYELSLVNGMLTDAIIELTQNETDANKLYYLEKIAKKFAEKTGKRINELKEGK